MDPISALIGAGASLIGGFMNTSSSQAINKANLAQQTWSSEGGYLPGLVANANAAGLSPLAVLGQRGPDMAVQVGTQPGQGLQKAGDTIAQMNDPVHDETMKRLAETKAQSEIASLNAGISNTAIEMARNQYALDQLRSHPEYLAPGNQEPAFRSSLIGGNIDAAEGVVGDVYRKLPFHAFGSALDYMRGQFSNVPPAGSYSTP